MLYNEVASLQTFYANWKAFCSHIAMCKNTNISWVIVLNILQYIAMYWIHYFQNIINLYYEGIGKEIIEYYIENIF